MRLSDPQRNALRDLVSAERATKRGPLDRFEILICARPRGNQSFVADPRTLRSLVRLGLVEEHRGPNAMPRYSSTREGRTWL